MFQIPSFSNISTAAIPQVHPQEIFPVESFFMLLNDRVAIVTGAGRGIGFGIADTFGRQGARVIIGEIVEARCRDAAEKLKARGWDAEALFLDVTQSSSCRDLIEKVMVDYVRIDIYLASDEASFVVGETLCVDGGWGAYQYF